MVPEWVQSLERRMDDIEEWIRKDEEWKCEDEEWKCCIDERLQKAGL
jgi:hypothetical protein